MAVRQPSRVLYARETNKLLLEWLPYDLNNPLTTSVEPGETITFLQAAPANLANISMNVDHRRPEDATLYLGMLTASTSVQDFKILFLTSSLRVFCYVSNRCRSCYSTRLSVQWQAKQYRRRGNTAAGAKWGGNPLLLFVERFGKCRNGKCVQCIVCHWSCP